MGTCCYESGPDLYHDEIRRARKHYHCCECGVGIEPGDQYEHVSSFDEGMWIRYRTCIPCADLRESLSDVTCVYMEGLSEAYTEYLTEAPGISMVVKPGTHAAKLVPTYFIEEEEDAEEPIAQ